MVRIGILRYHLCVHDPAQLFAYSHHGLGANGRHDGFRCQLCARWFDWHFLHGQHDYLVNQVPLFSKLLLINEYNVPAGLEPTVPH